MLDSPSAATSIATTKSRVVDMAKKRMFFLVVSFFPYPASSMSEVKGAPSITGHVGKKVAFVEIGRVRTCKYRTNS